MKKKLLASILLFAGIGVIYFTGFYKSETEKLRERHQSFLDNSPFEETKTLSRQERKDKGLPPNAYYEQMWELTLDPRTGRPMPERIERLQQDLKNQRNAEGGGGDTSNPWLDRGPNNIGGRTRGIMFDPNDTNFNRVFAGGVSGGLWINEDITDANSSWTLVPGIGANISVTTIIYDPNDLDTFYIGSGESYTSGDAVGRGVWKSTDRGVTWVNIFGGPDGTITNSGQVINGIFYINDIVARDIGATTEIYIAVAGAFYSASATNISGGANFNGLNDQGVYKSVDDGSNWTRFTINETGGTPSNPNDIELDIDNNIWFTTTRSSFGIDGGKVFRSTDGVAFTLMHTFSNTNRTELAVSKTDVNKLWVAVNTGGQADLYITDDAFATTPTRLAEPNDADNGISSTDYTRGQAGYDLPIEVDANDNVYVGGIDLFRSTDEGTSWTQISKWSNNPGLNTLNVPLVHADQHAIVFRPGTGNEKQAVFGTDGGIYYTADITLAQASLNISSRNKDYNVTQFYYGSIGPSTSNEIIYGGAQDNGTLISQNSTSGANGFENYFAFFSGDGSYSEIDNNGGLTGFGDGEYMIVGSVFVNYRLASPAVSSSNNAFNTGYDIHTSGNTEGNFINEAELDHVGNILYANTSTSSVLSIGRFTLGPTSAAELSLRNALLTDEPSALKVSPFDNTTLLVGLRDSKLLKVTDANASETWSDITGPSFVGSISDIEYGVTANDIFVTIHNYGVTSIWSTDDGGSTWTNIEGDLPDLPVKCILQNPLLPTELIIGTELGVWRTADYTATNVVWVQSYNGMSDVTVQDLDLRTADNTILATTYGRGFFTSSFTATTASLDDVLTDKKVFTVYPTISNGDFTVFAKTDLGKTAIKIFDIAGKQVYSSDLNFNENSNQLVSVNLKSGMYIVNLVDQNNRKSSGKIIIR
tara:strand:- start:513 stop:3302 length:2790 start_codon:yes stop_codon:yes gene_type:complete